jgi:hypothetical protein
MEVVQGRPQPALLSARAAPVPALPEMIDNFEPEAKLIACLRSWKGLSGLHSRAIS